MSAKRHLRNSNLFDENEPQRNPTLKGTTCFRLKEADRGASIYATDVGQFGISRSALENRRFPNNDRLYEFVKADHTRMSPNSFKAFMLDDSHILEIIHIIRG